MATQVTNYQCPACTGPLHFVGASGKLECDYCGNAYDAAEIEALYAEKEQAALEAAQNAEEKASDSDSEWNLDGVGGRWDAEEAANLRSYTCPSCGAGIICDVNTAATSCAYCGNPTVVPGQLGGALKPDLVIPFKLDKKAAMAALKKHYQKKLFLPGSFSTANALEEIKGIYVPFWLFDCRADGRVTFNGETSKTSVQGDYQVTTVSHYNLYREGAVDFEKVPVDASTKMPDEHMDAIEPYDYAELRPFSTAYLPGFLADKYDVKSKECAERADERIRNSTIDALSGTINGYLNVRVKSQKISMNERRAHYALLPVWLITTKWQNKPFIFAMNGQTGKFVGTLPSSRLKMFLWTLAFSAPAAALLSWLAFFL